MVGASVPGTSVVGASCEVSRPHVIREHATTGEPGQMGGPVGDLHRVLPRSLVGDAPQGVQGRGEAAQRLVADARALEEAGCFAVVLEMVPAPAAQAVSDALRVPTVGIGAGPGCDAQVLVWTDFAGLRGGRMPRFVKQYADLRTTLTDAARQYARDVADGSFPGEEHSFPE